MVSVIINAKFDNNPQTPQETQPTPPTQPQTPEEENIT
jgi:hypothetical protein